MKTASSYLKKKDKKSLLYEAKSHLSREVTLPSKSPWGMLNVSEIWQLNGCLQNTAVKFEKRCYLDFYYLDIKYYHHCLIFHLLLHDWSDRKNNLKTRPTGKVNVCACLVHWWLFHSMYYNTEARLTCDIHAWEAVASGRDGWWQKKLKLWDRNIATTMAIIKECSCCRPSFQWHVKLCWESLNMWYISKHRGL